MKVGKATPPAAQYASGFRETQPVWPVRFQGSVAIKEQERRAVQYQSRFCLLLQQWQY
jgi:hypothetical protein